LIGKVNAEVRRRYAPRGASPGAASGAGTTRLPLLGERQPGRQRAVLKVQDGCDAHCTYCIIPTLRPIPWSKPVDDVVEEARRLVDAGHVEVVLTGIFLGAYGQPTALRRRQPRGGTPPLGQLVEALCTRVPSLRRLRLSSLEPGDLSDDLVRVLRGHPPVVPHFHLPLQSGSDVLLRRMNRQYGRDDFLRMIDRVRAAFDRPALTTDVIAGFPGETDEEFARTLEVVDHAAFIHVHAFPFSARPGTAAARWVDSFVRGPAVNERIETLRRRAADHSFEFRRQFIGETVELLVEEGEAVNPRTEDAGDASATIVATRHGRCERYFDVHFDEAEAQPGDFLRVRVDEVTPRRTCGSCVSREVRAGAGGRA
jgi:MiaB/RimO family radical SAM methylthiotransferase